MMVIGSQFGGLALPKSPYEVVWFSVLPLAGYSVQGLWLGLRVYIRSFIGVLGLRRVIYELYGGL